MNQRFDQLLDLLQSKRLPPVESWQPQREGTIDIRIRKDGVWFHDGSEIKRVGIAKIFSTILRKDGDAYFLVTPAEKLRIEVEDAPFVAIDMEASGEGTDQIIAFKTQTDDVVIVDADHPFSFAASVHEVRPYVLVRNGMKALIQRSVFYRLVDLVEDPNANPLQIWSGGTRFAMEPADSG